MIRIDTHIHLYEPVGLDWLKPKQVQLNQIHDAQRFINVSAATPINRAIVVEAGSTMAHNEWMLEHTADEPAAAAVIGNLDLSDPDTKNVLQQFMRYPKFRGLRNRARGRIDFSSPVVQENFQFLESHKLIFETGLDQHTRKKIVLLAKTYPKLTIIINHLGDGRLDADNHPQVWWPPLMAQLGSCSNVYCKLSMFDHVFKNDFAPERLDALFDPLLKAFGPDRLLYGSNWPVSPDYTAMFSLFAKQLDANPDLKEQILTTNPIKAYRLEFNP